MDDWRGAGLMLIPQNFGLPEPLLNHNLKSIIMKNLKIIGMLILLVSFMACKKDKVTPEPAEEPFDITEYVLVEKGLGLEDEDHIITTFELQGKATWYTLIGALTGPTYTYDNGVLKIYLAGTLEREFKIEDRKIVSYSPKAKLYTCQLVKTSKSNQLNGNTYAGGWKTEGSNLTFIASLKFNDTHYSEASINLPEPNTTYKTIKNVGAFSSIDFVNTIWITIDGKLEGSRKPANGNVSIGTFTKK